MTRDQIKKYMNDYLNNHSKCALTSEINRKDSVNYP
jgi:hypothetical protein